MQINPSAVIFWAIGAAIGYLVNGVTGALVGFVVTGTFSLLSQVLDK